MTGHLVTSGNYDTPPPGGTYDPFSMVMNANYDSAEKDVCIYNPI